MIIPLQDLLVYGATLKRLTGVVVEVFSLSGTTDSESPKTLD